MNWADGADIGAELLPRKVKRIIAGLICFAILIPGHPGVLLLMAYGQAKAASMMEDFTKGLQLPAPTPAR